MRVEGNGVPEQIHVEACPNAPGMAELRMRENVIPSENPGLYLYDEYVLLVPDHPGLYEQIQQDPEPWLAAGRAKEEDVYSSLNERLRSALDIVIPGGERGREQECAQEYNREMKAALSLIYDALNQGQQQKLMKEAAVKALFRRYGLGEEA